MTDQELDALLRSTEPTRTSLTAAWPRAHMTDLIDRVGEVVMSVFGVGFAVWSLASGARTEVAAFGVFVAIFVIAHATMSLATRWSRAAHEPANTRAFLHASQRNLTLAQVHNTFTRVMNVVGVLVTFVLMGYTYTQALHIGPTTHMATGFVVLVFLGCVVSAERDRRDITAQRDRLESWLLEFEDPVVPE